MSFRARKLDSSPADDDPSVVELRSSQKQMRRLAASLQTAREEERADLARELHDELGQTLTALKLELGRAADALKAVRLDPPVMDRLQSLVGLVEIGVAMVKRIATKLRPPALDHLGLAEAIRWEAATFRSRSGLRCHVVAGNERDGLDGQAADRAVPDLSGSAHQRRPPCAGQRRASQADRSARRIRAAASATTVAASRGRKSPTPDRSGCFGMRERAMQAGATLEIAGVPGKGTVVTVSVPLPARTAGAGAKQRRKALRRGSRESSGRPFAKARAKAQGRRRGGVGDDPHPAG